VADAPATGNILTRKLGPLPGWAWAAVAAGGGYLWLRHENSTSAASDDDTTDEEDATDQDTGAAGGQDFETPYQGAGVYTALANADAEEESEAKTAEKDSKRLKSYEGAHPAGRVNKKTHVYTATAATTLSRLAARFGVTVAALKKANPNLKTGKVSKGERVHIP
jgi:LysM repeat protein